MSAEPKAGTMTSINIPMHMAICVHCGGPIARAEMPNAPGEWLHITGNKDCENVQ